MDACFHHDEITFWQGLQLIRREERSLHHLQRFGGIGFASGYRTRHNGAASKCFRQCISRGAVWCEAAEQRDLRIVDDDLAALLAVVLFELGKGLDDWDDLQASGSGRAEHHLRRFDFRQRTELVTEEHTSIFELPAVFICHSQDFTIELLDDQGDHKEGVGVFLRHDDKDGRFLAAELLSVDLCIET